MAEFKEDILICVGYDAISFFHLKTAEVINDMLDKGLIKSDNSLLAPGYALPEFYTETGKYKLPASKEVVMQTNFKAFVLSKELF